MILEPRTFLLNWLFLSKGIKSHLVTSSCLFQIDQNPLTTDGAILLMKSMEHSESTQISDVHMVVSKTIYFAYRNDIFYVTISKGFADDI